MRNVFLIYLYPLVLALLTLIQLFQDDRQDDFLTEINNMTALKFTAMFCRDIV